MTREHRDVAVKYMVYNVHLNIKRVAYPEKIRQAAIKTYYSGVSEWGVGHIFHMSKSNVYNWIKKTKQ